ncbi:MAG TPA: DUF2971 domain-containing protein [Verrucomicrobiae bacterium]|jgi:hypothetical protein|nr:DUF2971 domain-containing protein [Verrucomicrobiae bacterium]
MAKDLRRYTDLSRLFYLLAERKLTLLDASGWDDRNDRYCLRRYREAKGHKSVLALCLVQSSERYHLWKVFGVGASGVRIKFKREALLEAVDKVEGVLHDKVKYLTLKELGGSFSEDRLPFLKRYGFLEEEEYRLVYGSDKELTKFDIDIPPDCIESVKLNPWLDADSFGRVREAIRKVNSCWKSLEVAQSTLIDNEKWREFADRVSGI